MNTPNTSTPAAQVPPSNKRKTLMLSLAAIFGVAAIAYGAYWYIYERHYETTDNAYVQGNVVQVTSQIAGTVLAIQAQDTDYVKEGQALVRLDPTDAQTALDQAQAQLAQTVRETRTLYANNSTLSSTIALRQADVQKANVDLARAEEDYKRRQPLVATGAVSAEELEHARVALAAARSTKEAAMAGLTAAQNSLGSNRSLTDGVPVEQHPNVLRAAAHVREAYLNLQRANLVAPVSGVVAKRSVQVGQRIAPGNPLMAIVPLNQLWVDANFKEVQLRSMRIGQPVTLKADIYGGDVVFHGKVVGLGAGTGAAFSLLPAQNATGNWIKVVQRVPVRIALNNDELAKHPLRIGLSMDAEVDVADQSGQNLGNNASASDASTTDVFTQSNAEADALVNRIVSANLGRAVVVPALPAKAASAAATPKV